MKVFLSAICGFILCTLVLANPAFVQHRTSLLGAKECTWGPSYWCSSLQNAKGCNAVTHCIKSVWEKQRVPQDNDSICKICKDMVKQARDQLESNETQEELRDVFEGSCKLIHIKPIVKECCKLADDFIPELVETLASQMNPDMVCSVAGLCNNARIDEMLAAQPQIEDIADTSMSDEDNHEDDFNCEKCNKISTLLSAKFQMTERDSVLENMLMMCGRLSSYSDSCSNLVLLNFNEIYGHLEEAITPDNICHMSGACSSKYHQHQERLVEINTKSDVGFVDKDDIPCELCEQLVRHLRDLLIANTTESEFKSVLQGLCNQTKGFKKECLTIVDEYYDVIYKSLVTNLDDQGMCFMIGVCPKGLQDKKTFVPVMPKLPVNKLEVSITEKPKRKLLGANEPKFSMAEIQSFQLPIDQSPLLLPGQFVGNLEGNTQSCSLCEYILHFIQEDLSLPKTSDKLKTYVEKLCHKLPSPIREDCDDFVTTYGDAVIALLVQGIDPRECCPKMNLCPKPARIQVTIITESKPSDKPQCPLCLLAVTNAQNQIQSDKSKTHIKKILKNLCKHAKSNLRVECEDFVDTYTSQLLDLLARDFSAQQICTELKCCVDNKEQEFERHVYDTISDESNSNEIFDNTVNGQVVPLDGPSEYEDTPNCMLCKFLITQVERKLHKKSDKEIDDALNHVCDKMHKVQSKCRRFIDKHREQIKRMIKKQMLPKQICHALGMCLRSEETLEEIEAYIDLKDDTKVNDYPPIENQQCTLCQIMVTQVEQELKNKKTRAEIQHALEHACSLVPPKTRSKCDEFIEQYTDLIINLLDTVPPKEVCKRLGFCNDQLQVELFDVHRQLMTEDLTDCAVCNSAAKSLKDLQEWMTDDHEILSEGCSRLPGKHHDKCHSLVVPYGISLLNLIRRGELDTACSQIGMCYRNQYLTLADLD